MIQAGQTLQNRYRIDRQIGQGGMGAVYVATDERFNSTVAIKETLCMDDNFRKAIEREARLLNALKHPALPRVSDHFEEDNGQFLVMEYIPGDDICCVLETAENPVTVDKILKWADQLLDALVYLHTQESPIIHRDIKPQNVKVTPKGDAILLDFGLAKGNPTDAGNVTAAKSIFGYSRNYASLEQIQGTGTDPRSDLYSLAATLHHVLTKTPPEDALTRAMAVLSSKPDPLAPVSRIDPSIPRGVAGILYKAMSLNAEERPGTAAEMRSMLREHDKYGYLADDATVAMGGATGVFAQDTELMPHATKAERRKATEAKTEVLPTNPSQATSVKAGGGKHTRALAAGMTGVEPRKGRGASMAAGALILLGVGGAIAGGVYLVKPSVFGVAPQEVQTGSPAANPLPLAVENNTAGNSATSVAAEPNAESNAAPAESRAGSAAKDAPKNEKRKSESSADNQSDASDLTVSVPKVEVREVPGGIEIVKIENGKTTVTRVDTIPKNFRPMSPEQERALRNIDPGKLTPEQRRKLQRVYRFKPRPPGTEPPPDTPPQN